MALCFELYTSIIIPSIKRDREGGTEKGRQRRWDRERRGQGRERLETRDQRPEDQKTRRPEARNQRQEQSDQNAVVRVRNEQSSKRPYRLQYYVSERSQ